ncbi:oxygen-insensitive NADPH nitroreductase [Paenibacillus sediminis]|uniref:FMN reductase (NADPH) n=1 Tax=Paenibacillus sediminis TaxID=664909 RepID=A0ABS4H351_9BACL|nr:oxygen-insensitive NADPH nitroreductase [Paenibacillus sediminis]MBP1936950.1 FMN reductase (NADPH) [Paenibacillus sediminis]
MNDTISLLMKHRSVRKFTNEPVTEEQLETIVAAGQMASSSSHVQAYSVIAVTDDKLKKELSELCGNQAYIAECPTFLVWCADLYRLKTITEEHYPDKKAFVDTTESFIIATVDTALAAQNAAVAAESLGLGIVYIGGIRNRIEEVTRLLELPKHVYPVFGMCVGHPDQQTMLRPRLPQKAVLHRNKYSTDAVNEVSNYDVTMSRYLSERTGGKNDTPWSKLMADKLTQPARIHMRDYLKEQGFELK